MPADYAPVFLPGERIPVTVSGTVAAGDLLAVSGSGTVAKAAALAVTSWVGTAAFAALANARCTMYGRGTVHESIADGAVTAGDQLTTTNTANRQVKSLPASAADVGASPTQASINTALNGAANNARAVIGIALITAADNAKVTWMEM